MPHRQQDLLLPALRRLTVSIRPSREEFRELARDHTVIPVWRELLADLITPVAAFARLTRSGEPGFLFESVEHGERWSRWSFVGRRPAATLIRLCWNASQKLVTDVITSAATAVPFLRSSPKKR